MDYFNELRKIVVDNFDEIDQKKILNGNNQQIYILYRIWSNQYNYIDYNETLPNLELIVDKLNNIQEFKIVEFLEYMDTLNYSNSEFRDFFRQTLSESLQNLTQDIIDFTKYWKFIEGKLDKNDKKLILFHKQIMNDQTILFQIRQLKPNFAQIIFNFLEKHLNSREISVLLLQRDRSENATLMSYDIESHGDLETLNLTWIFIQNHTTDGQQRQMLSSYNGIIWSIKAVWTTKNAEILGFYTQIFMDLFTKPELCDMITELVEGMNIFAINSEEHGKDESLVTTKRKEFLEDICEGDEKRLGNIYSGIIDMYIR